MSKNINDLLAIMATLRDPQHGCAWYKAQSYQSIVPYTLEEAYEVADTIERGAIDELPDELGDLLFQVVFYSQIGKEQGRFSFDDCVSAICDKLIRRHPHVFPDASAEATGAAPADASTALQGWEAIKAAERGEQGQHSVLDNVPTGLPALTRAYKLQKRCASVGFDWPGIEGSWDKVKEEIAEVDAELVHGVCPENTALAEELGDLMFALVNVVRKAGFQPETLLRSANQKFERRFRQVEQLLADSEAQVGVASLEQMEQAWQQVKLQEKMPR
jgi:ATP diphosphatase